MLANIFSQQNRSLLREFVRTDFKLRYQGSVLGYLWSLVRPLALFTVLYIVFAHFFRFGNTIPHFPSYLLLGIVIWTFFTEATNAGMVSIVNRSDLVRKVSLPRYLIVMSTAFSALINLGVNLFIVAGFMLITGADVSRFIVFMPLLILELFGLALACSFLLSALFVKYRDIAYIWELVLQILFYATPIIYPLNIVPVKFIDIVLLNPMAQIIQDARFLAITDQTITVFNHLPVYLMPIPWVLIFGTALVAGFYFKKQSKTFAENI